MKRLILVALCVAPMFAMSSFAEDGKLRKCNFYEIMNDEDEDGLVQGASGQSVCYYLASDSSVQTKSDIKIDDIKGDSVKAKVHLEIPGIEGDSRVIDNAEESAEDVKDSAVLDPVQVDGSRKSSGEGATGQTRRRTVTITNTGEETANKCVTPMRCAIVPPVAECPIPSKCAAKELDKSSTKAQDYNSSRSNRRGARDAASGLPTGKRQHSRKLDSDDDGDGVPTEDTSK